MTLLSDKDIVKELGKNLYIFPLNIKNIKASSVNLSASKWAWSLGTKKLISDESTGNITIPPHDTALIETEETLHVSAKIGGTYHSKVKLVSAGAGHIGTTLDPYWVGPSLIAIHNTSDHKIEIAIGDSFVSVMFYYVKTPSSIEDRTNPGGRTELLDGFEKVDQLRRWLEDERWRCHPDELEKVLKESSEFRALRAKGSLFWTKSIIFVTLLTVFIAIGYSINEYTPSAWLDKPYTMPLVICILAFSFNKLYDIVSDFSSQKVGKKSEK